MKHNIYLIEETTKSRTKYDSFDAHVVIADKPKEAREVCGEKRFLNPRLTSIKKIGESDMKKQIVMSSFNSG